MIRSICSCNVKAIFLPSKSWVRVVSDYFTTPHRLLLKIGLDPHTPSFHSKSLDRNIKSKLVPVKTAKNVKTVKLTVLPNVAIRLVR